MLGVVFGTFADVPYSRQLIHPSGHQDRAFCLSCYGGYMSGSSLYPVWELALFLFSLTFTERRYNFICLESPAATSFPSVPPTSSEFGRPLTLFKQLCRGQGLIRHTLSIVYKMLLAQREDFQSLFLSIWCKDLNLSLNNTTTSEDYLTLVSKPRPASPYSGSRRLPPLSRNGHIMCKRTRDLRFHIEPLD